MKVNKDIFYHAYSGDEELEGQIEWVINRWFEEGTKIPKDL
jgi:hypothetical protein